MRAMMVAVIVVFAGNRIDGPDRADPQFPPGNEGAVSRRLGEVLASIAPRLVVGAAAAGADLLVHEAAARLAITRHVVLPLPVSEFRARSVADSSPEWESRFERALADAAAVTIEDCSEAGDVFRTGNTRIQALAASLAADSEPVTALVVRPPSSGEPSVTDHFATEAADRGWPVVDVDPLDA